MKPLPWISAVLCALALSGCSEERGATATSGTSPPEGPPTEAPPPRRKLIEIDLLDGYALDERSQGLHFDFQATSSIIAFGLDFEDPTPRATKLFWSRAPMGQDVVRLSPAPQGTALISNVYVEGSEPLTASVWVGRSTDEPPPAPANLQIAVVAFSPGLGSAPVALEIDASDAEPREIEGVAWTEHRALLPPDLVGWAWFSVMHSGSGELFLNGLSVAPAQAESRRAQPRWLEDAEHRAIAHAGLRTRRRP